MPAPRRPEHIVDDAHEDDPADWVGALLADEPDDYLDELDDAA